MKRPLSSDDGNSNGNESNGHNGGNDRDKFPNFAQSRDRYLSEKLSPSFLRPTGGSNNKQLNGTGHADAQPRQNGMFLATRSGLRGEPETSKTTTAQATSHLPPSPHRSPQLSSSIPFHIPSRRSPRQSPRHSPRHSPEASLSPSPSPTQTPRTRTRTRARQASQSATDGLLARSIAKDLSNLPKDERSQLRNEMHGVSQMVQEEDSSVVDLCLNLIDAEISKKRTKAAYNRALFLSPKYTLDRNLRLLFLQANRFEVLRATEKFIAYFEHKLRLFGLDCLVRPLTVHNALGPAEIELLDSGSLQFAPCIKDNQGRTLLIDVASYLCHQLMPANKSQAVDAPTVGHIDAGDGAATTSDGGTAMHANGMRSDSSMMGKDHLDERWDHGSNMKRSTYNHTNVGGAQDVHASFSGMTFTTTGSTRDAGTIPTISGNANIKRERAASIGCDGMSGTEQHNAAIHSRVKLWWFLAMKALEDRQTQIRGIVAVLYHIHANPVHIDHQIEHLSLIQEYLQHIEAISSCLPIRYVCRHFCYDQVGIEDILNDLSVSMHRNTRMRLQTFVGDTEGAVTYLGSFGISRDKLPVDLTGQVKINPEFRKYTCSMLHGQGSVYSGMATCADINNSTKQTEPAWPSWPLSLPPVPSQALPIRWKQHQQHQSQQNQWQQHPFPPSPIESSRRTPHASTAHSIQRGSVETRQAVEVEPPTSLDVLLGRGKPFQEHPGNARLQQLVDDFRPQHEASSYSDKHEISKRIVNMIRESGGRFLKRTKDIENTWEVANPAAAREKVSHAFRTKSAASKKNDIERQEFQKVLDPGTR